MIGSGLISEIKKYADNLKISDCTVFTGPIYDREYLRVFYSVADVFLFPSTYDTSGIVVKEAAACSCPTLLVRGSCAAEGVEHKFSGYLAEENADSCADVLADACQSREDLKQVGINAGKHVYLSWEKAVERAMHRYNEILNTDIKHLPYNSKARWA